MTILEKMKELNSVQFEHKISDKYYLYIEGLTKNGEAFSYGMPNESFDEVKDVLIELHICWEDLTSEYMETLDPVSVNLNTNLEDLTVEFVQKTVGFLLD